MFKHKLVIHPPCEYCHKHETQDHLMSMQKKNPFNELSHFFMIKFLENRGLQGTYINTIASIYRTCIVPSLLGLKLMNCYPVLRMWLAIDGFALGKGFRFFLRFIP